MRRGRRGDDLLRARAFPAVGDVVADRACEEPGVLQDHPEGAPDRIAWQIARVDSVEQDPTTVDLVEAHEEIHDGGLPRPGRSDDRDGLAFAHVEAEFLDQGLVGDVAERHAVERHPAGRGWQHRCGHAVGLLLRRREELEDTLSRGEPGLKQVRLRRDLRDRHRELPRVLDECLDVTERHRASRHAKATDDRDANVVEVRQELHRGLDDP